MSNLGRKPVAQIGQRIGRLVAIERVPGGYRWRCDCGAIVKRSATHVKKIADPACRQCLRAKQSPEGTSIKGWVAISYEGVDKNRNAIWLWRCRCGASERTASATYIRNYVTAPKCCG
jgi:hypothetical protein